MEHFKTKGIYDMESDVYRFFSIEEMREHKTDCINWKHCLRDAEKYLGKKWHSDEVRYYVEGAPVYKMYTIVGFEDNNAWADYYWIVRPVGMTDNSKDEYKLWNCHDFYEKIVTKA